MEFQTITCKCTAEETLKVYGFDAENNVMHDVLKSTVVAATEVEIDSDVIYVLLYLL